MEGTLEQRTAPRTVAEVKTALDAVLPLVSSSVETIERTGRLPDELVGALAQAGVNRLSIPAALGGLQAPVADMLDVVEALAAADGSTAWCTVIAVGSNLFAGYLPPDAAREVFADPDRGNATMFAPVGRIADDGSGPRLTGRWPFTSNCLHSEWVGLGTLLDAPGGVDRVPRVAFVPVADIVIEDTWHSVGLRGTGSHHVSAAGLAVDLRRSCTFFDPAWPEGTLWRVPLYTVLLPLLATVPLGIARSALDELGRQAREGRDARRGQLIDDPISLGELAAADAQLRGARAGLREAVQEIHALAERGDQVPRPLQARTFLAALHACDVSAEVTSVAHNLGGGASAYSGSALLRALCDVQTGRQHVLFAHKHRSEVAKILVGLDAAYPPFIA